MSGQGSKICHHAIFPAESVRTIAVAEYGAAYNDRAISRNRLRVTVKCAKRSKVKDHAILPAEGAFASIIGVRHSVAIPHNHGTVGG